MIPESGRVETALARLDTAAKNDGIEPGTYLGGWADAQRDLVEALLGLEHRREAQLQDVLTTAKTATEAGAETMRLQVEAMQLELRKFDRFIEQAKISLGEKESATVQALVDGFTEKANEVWWPAPEPGARRATCKRQGGWRSLVFSWSGLATGPRPAGRALGRRLTSSSSAPARCGRTRRQGGPSAPSRCWAISSACLAWHSSVLARQQYGKVACFDPRFLECWERVACGW